MSSSEDRACWCGNTELQPFGPHYGLCETCDTLVSLSGLTFAQAQVNDDDTDFYGKQYWLNHQSRDLGFPDINTRARNDFTERNLHWLKALLKYRLPPAKTLELGCSHGGFVALLQRSGYDAMGIELSPWVVEFGRRTFGVPVLVGPVEDVDISPGSLDVIALMDVLEHLPDPAATMAHCVTLLKPDGLLLIQTPKLEEGIDYETLVETNDAFLDQLKADEHLYLFSQRSVTRLFRQIGVVHLEFEPAIFHQYDMFFAASREPLAEQPAEAAEQCLLGSPDGRIVLALLDLRRREEQTVERFLESESARANQNRDIETLNHLVRESGLNRVALTEQIQTLTEWLKESEADRTALREQVATFEGWLKESETDRAALRQQIDTLNRLVKDADADRAEQRKVLESLEPLRKELESEREQVRQAVCGLLSRASFRFASRAAGWQETQRLHDWLQREK